MSPKQKPVVVEFKSPDYPSPRDKEYFIGASLDDVLEDTEQGTKFGFSEFSSYRVVPLKEAEKLNLGFYREGYDIVQKGECKSFMLNSNG